MYFKFANIIHIFSHDKDSQEMLYSNIDKGQISSNDFLLKIHHLAEKFCLNQKYMRVFFILIRYGIV